MAVPYSRLKCEFILNLDESLVTFLMVLDIFYDEFVNSILGNKNGGTQMANQKLNSSINLVEIQYLGIPDITDYK